MKKICLSLFSLLNVCVMAQSPHTFSDLSALLDYAEKHSYTTILGQKQQELAKLTRQAAIGQVVNPRIPSSAALTDNARQPVSFIPAEIFGGPSGTFREITMGQQYVSNFSIAPQFDIINMANIGRYKTAQINEKMVLNQNLLTKKALLEQVAASYYTILSYRAQLKIIAENRLIADSLLALVEQRHRQGIARQQEINEAQVNSLTWGDKAQQLALQEAQELQRLALLCDLPEGIALADVSLSMPVAIAPTASVNPLATRQWHLQQEMTAQELKIAYYQQLPTLSFVSALNWQNNSNQRFFDGQAAWIKSNYWGLRLNWDLPTTVSKLTTLKNTQINADMQAVQARHVALEAEKQTENLRLDYERARTQWQHYQEVTRLKADTYKKYEAQYEAQIMAIDRVLMAQNDWFISRLSQDVAAVQMAFIASKIDINNRIK